MSKWLRYEKAKANSMYLEIVDAANDFLSMRACFGKTEVLKKSGYDVVDEENIRWDYIKRMVEEGAAPLFDAAGVKDQKYCELMPMAAAFFKRCATIQGRGENLDRKAEQQKYPERFIASGYGKKTAGFALVIPKNGHFVLCYLDRKRKVAKGSVKAANKSLEIASRSAVETLPGKLPE